MSWLVDKCGFVVVVVVARGNSGGQEDGGCAVRGKQIGFGASSLEPLFFTTCITFVVKCHKCIENFLYVQRLGSATKQFAVLLVS